MTITAPITDDTGESIEEDEDIDLRARLGFRSPLIASNGPHPDSEHCPSWCWLTADNPEGYDHEIDPHHPMTAHHTLASTPSIVASLYPGEHMRSEYDAVHTATLETHLDQDGGQDPVIAVNLRHYPERHKQEYDQRLRLTVSDARELITALTYVCDVAEGHVPALIRTSAEVRSDAEG
jgi:hypothetical protein